MKKYPKIVQCDRRGQIVIPKDIRHELDIEEGTGFFMYAISDEGILLKKISRKELPEEEVMKELEQKAEKIGVKGKNLEKAKEAYKRRKKGRLEII
jgi:AbrB family looped-hinge helix DNA binding protein